MSSVLVAGSNGMVGRALTRQLSKIYPRDQLIFCTREDVDLTDKNAVLEFVRRHEPASIICAAAKVGGIEANNNQRAEFIYQNLSIQMNLIVAAHLIGAKLLLLGSSCIYPREARIPISENQLLTGSLEDTNEPYAIAKIAAIKMAESYNRQYGTDFRCVMPCNLYGPFDNFDLASSHVIPGLLRKFNMAVACGSNEVELWGSGRPLREFLHVDDLARAIVTVLELPQSDFSECIASEVPMINVGFGSDLSILRLAELIARTVDFDGEIVWNPQYPDGTYRKLVDSTRITRLGWRPRINLEKGLSATYRWALKEGVI